MSAVTEQTTRSVPVAPSPLLRERLRALRRRHVSTAALTGLALAVSLAVELMAVAMFADWWFDLPWALRFLILIGWCGAVGYVLVLHVLRPLWFQPDEDDIALMVERARPEFRSRLISAVQLSRPGGLPPGASAALARALILETEAMARHTEFSRVVSTERLKKLGALAVLVLALGLWALAYGRPATVDLLKRFFLAHVPVPRKTYVIVKDGDKTIGRGDNVLLEAFAKGIVPDTGRLEIRMRRREPQEILLQPDPQNRARFAHLLENVQESFDYIIYLNDGRSPTHTVRVLPRPSVAAIECRQVYPAYTGLRPVNRTLGDLTLLAGSVLELDIRATKPIAQASLRLVGLNTNAPLAIDPADPRHLQGKLFIPARGLTGFSVLLTDTDQMQSKDEAVYRLEVLPDRVPEVRLTYPDRKEELVTQQALMLIAFEANDDFQLAAVRLRYKSEALDGGSVQSVELDLGDTPQRELRRRFEWNLENFDPPLPLGSTIEYWIEAVDNNDTTGPGVGSSEHQFARVVTPAEKRADLLNRAGDFLGSISDVAGDQEQLNRDLGEIIRAKAGLK